ncbi:nitroreductase family protein [Cetobacterium somerae]|uniref:nitroreductase family protein n=1 Tax=Cetobacterium sp. NK01 TaxID=2993530 RepID=UPI002115EB68|nr:nitroreductase family protein [Cetobacterium sp. NK01]MCQ8213391.1 nitroreductase family protein [Cetobacterium sp. NK01]
MEILNLIKNARSHRSFKNIVVPMKDLMKIIEGAHFSSAGANKQFLRYFLINDKETCSKLFKDVIWASQIEWKPLEDEAPGAYIVIFTDNPPKLPLNFIYADCGIALQNMKLIATSLGYGANFMEPVKKDEILSLLNLSNEYIPLFVMPIGVPTDEIILTEAIDGNMKYYREDLGEHNYKHFVPKLPLDKLIIGKK